MSDEPVEYRGCIIVPLKQPSGDWQAHFYPDGHPEEVRRGLVGTGPTKDAAIEAANRTIDELLE